MANRENFAEPGAGVGQRTKNFKLEAGSNRYRIGPAYASLAPSGRWNLAIRQHYGYRTTGDEQHPNGFIRTFLCPQEVDKRTEMVKVACAECDDIAALKEKVELRESKLVQEGKTEEEIATILGPQKKYLKEHNLDKKHLVLAKNESNEWGVLWLPWKALEALLNRRKKILSEDGVDILSIKDGVWLDFTREGEGFRNTTYGCDVVYEIVTTDSGKKAKVMKQEPLSDADFDTIEASCPDLSTVGTRLSASQIERLVESRGDMEVVTAIFNEAWDVKKGRTKEASPTPKPTPKPAKEEAPKRVVAETPSPEPVKVVAKAEELVMGPPPVDTMAQIAALQAQLAALTATKLPNVQMSVPKSPAPSADPDSLPDDQFLEVFGPKKTA